MARQMKDLIRSQVAEGYTNEEVKEYFVSKYGEWVLLEPKAAGFNLLVYILPGVALLAGGALIVVTMVRQVVGSGAGAPADAQG
jgi:cytochrome c-type biogenesis protein CcmH